MRPFFAIALKNIKGFDLKSDPFKFMKIINYDRENIIWYLVNTNFDFYLNNSIVGPHVCNSNLSDWSLISKTWILDTRRDVQFSSKICPYVFNNCMVALFSFKISATLVGENLLSFQNVSATDLNSAIFQINIKLYHADLNQNILNKFVFKKLQMLDINGVIGSIQQDMFMSFERLGMLRLRSQNVRKLFSRNNKWLRSLNPLWNRQKLFDFFVLVVYQSMSNVTFYEYPDEDFCHFKSFPHEKLVRPMLKPASKSECTCLELFLIQYSARYGKSIERIVDNELSIYDYSNYYY